MFISLAFIFVHGIDYVNWPRLQPLTDIIYYDGPGYRAHRHGMGLGLPALEKLKAGAMASAKTMAEQQHRPPLVQLRMVDRELPQLHREQRLGVADLALRQQHLLRIQQQRDPFQLSFVQLVQRRLIC